MAVTAAPQATTARRAAGHCPASRRSRPAADSPRSIGARAEFLDRARSAGSRVRSLVGLTSSSTRPLSCSLRSSGIWSARGALSTEPASFAASTLATPEPAATGMSSPPPSRGSRLRCVSRTSTCRPGAAASGDAGDAAVTMNERDQRGWRASAREAAKPIRKTTLSIRSSRIRRRFSPVHAGRGTRLPSK